MGSDEAEDAEAARLLRFDSEADSTGGIDGGAVEMASHGAGLERGEKAFEEGDWAMGGEDVLEEDDGAGGATDAVEFAEDGDWIGHSAECERDADGVELVIGEWQVGGIALDESHRQAELVSTVACDGEHAIREIKRGA